jgi:hypothetical protein
MDYVVSKNFKKDQMVRRTGSERKGDIGIVVHDQETPFVKVSFYDNGKRIDREDAGYIQDVSEDHLEEAFPVGSRVKVVGLAGNGTVVSTQGRRELVDVKWDSGAQSSPLAMNILPAEESNPNDLEGAIDLIQKRRLELVRERNEAVRALDEQILDLEAAIKLLERLK